MARSGCYSLIEHLFFYIKIMLVRVRTKIQKIQTNELIFNEIVVWLIVSYVFPYYLWFLSISTYQLVGLLIDMRRSQHHAAKENDPRCPIAGQESELIGPGPPFCCSAVAQHSKRCSGMERSHIRAGVATWLSNFGIVPWLRTRQTATGDGRTFRSTPMFAQLSWHYHGH